MLLVPLLNGFPHTGALARTATNIKLGAISPLAGIFKFALKLMIAFYLARYLEMVPMACIAGILMYVAMNMVKKEEVTEVIHMGKAHIALMVWTAGAVIVTDFLKGVLSGLALYVIGTIIAKVRAAQPVGPRTVAHAPAAPSEPLAGPNAWVRFHGQAATSLHAPLNPAARALVRAEVGRDKGHELADLRPGQRGQWLRQIRQRAHVARSAFVHPAASVIGRVVLSENVHVAADTSIRADEGAPFFIGANTNVQDGVIIHALKEKFVRVGGELWAVHIGKSCSLAHDSLVHGPCVIGDDTFIGFKSTVHDSVVGAGCFIGHGALVVGVEVPPGRFVPHGAIIDTQEKANALGPASDQHAHFNEDVVEVNRGLAAAYQSHQRADGSAPREGLGRAVVDLDLHVAGRLGDAVLDHRPERIVRLAMADDDDARVLGDGRGGQAYGGRKGDGQKSEKLHVFPPWISRGHPADGRHAHSRPPAGEMQNPRCRLRRR
jgi:SulP family sulfate permease